MSDPPQIVNPGFFNGSQNFSVSNAQFMEITIVVNQPAATETTLPPLPPLKHSSTFFMGRDKYLQRLKDYFTAHVEGQRKSFLLHGLGGIGKTQICLKFIEQNPDLFLDVFWLHAGSEASIGLGLMQIAHANNAPPEAKQSPGSVLKWIAQKSKWLMVYDSADDHYSVVEKFLPPGNEGNILITSRNNGLKRLVWDAENVLQMEDDGAVSLLLKSAMLDGSSDHVKTLAHKLVAELGGIPLAIDQAGSYIQSCGCSIDDYLDLYKKNKHQLMSKRGFKGASGYGTSTYGTWDVSMQQIEDMAAKGIEDEAQAAQNAIRLLKIFAFLNHDNIPQELFKNAAENYRKNSGVDGAANSLPPFKLLDHQTLFLGEEGEWDGMNFLDGIQVLLSFSLIRTANNLYSMHLLVNVWSRNCIPKRDIIEHYHRARALLSCSIAVDWYIDNYAFCKALAPHVRFNTLHASELGLEGMYYDSEYDRYAIVFHHVGSWDEEQKVLKMALDERKTVFGSDHPETLTTMQNLAMTYLNQGEWDEAEKLQTDVMNTRKQSLGSEHLDTLTAMTNLADIYSNKARFHDAEKLQVDVLNARKEKLGLDHLDTLTTMDGLAETYWRQGRYNDAEKIQVDVMNARKSKFGADHPETLSTMDNLAATYMGQGRWNDAEKLQVVVLNVMKLKLGLEHPDTLTSLNNLASTYVNTGRLSEAEKLQVDVVNIRKRKLGPDHPDTLTIMDNLALTYLYQGRLDEAEQLQVETITAKKAKLGLGHPDTLTTMSSLAVTYTHKGKLNEAETLQVDLVNKMEMACGLNHPDTLTTRRNLGMTYCKQQRWDEAEKMQTQVMDASIAQLGSEHPDTFTVMSNLGYIYGAQGNWDKAEKLQMEALNGMERKLGLDNPDTLSAMNNLATTYRKLNKLDEAEMMFKDVIDRRKTKFGSDHQGTLASMGGLALTYGSQGKWDEAEALMSQTAQTMEQVMGPQHPTLLALKEIYTDLSKTRHDIDQHQTAPHDRLDIGDSKNLVLAKEGISMLSKSQGQLEDIKPKQEEKSSDSGPTVSPNSSEGDNLSINLSKDSRECGKKQDNESD